VGSHASVGGEILRMLRHRMTLYGQHLVDEDHLERQTSKPLI